MNEKARCVVCGELLRFPSTEYVTEIVEYTRVSANPTVDHEVLRVPVTSKRETLDIHCPSCGVVYAKPPYT